MGTRNNIPSRNNNRSVVILKFYNRLDEQQRFIELFMTNEPSGQADTHGMSYLACREVYEQMGEQMGLNALVESGIDKIIDWEQYFPETITKRET